MVTCCGGFRWVFFDVAVAVEVAPVVIERDGDEWWLSVSGDIRILSGDDGDGGCFND